MFSYNYKSMRELEVSSTGELRIIVDQSREDYDIDQLYRQVVLDNEQLVGDMVELYDALQGIKQALDTLNIVDKDGYLSRFTVTFSDGFKTEVQKAMGIDRISMSRDKSRFISNTTNTTFYKTLEVLSRFGLHPATDAATVFDTCGLTGQTLYAINYYMTIALKKRLTWFANSDLENIMKTTNRNYNQNHDPFNLMTRYPGYWILNDPSAKSKKNLTKGELAQKKAAEAENKSKKAEELKEWEDEEDAAFEADKLKRIDEYELLNIVNSERNKKEREFKIIHDSKKQRKRQEMNHRIGDLSQFDNVAFISNALQNVPFDLVFGDYIVDSSGNYDNQEEFFLPYIVGQILLAIQLLRPGSSFCFKQFLISLPFTFSYLYALSFMFDKVYIVKPNISKIQNSEVYIVCKGYKHVGRECRCRGANSDPECGAKNNCKPMRDLYDVLKAALVSKKFVPFVDKRDLAPFMIKVMSYLKEIYTSQCTTIGNIYEYVTDKNFAGIGQDNVKILIKDFVNHEVTMKAARAEFMKVCKFEKITKIEDYIL